MYERRNFQQIVEELIEEGGRTPAQVAAECGCTESYIRAIRSGKHKECGYTIGARLIEMHEEMTNEQD